MHWDDNTAEDMGHLKPPHACRKEPVSIGKTTINGLFDIPGFSQIPWVVQAITTLDAGSGST
jgi:hypothetical protein